MGVRDENSSAIDYIVLVLTDRAEIQPTLATEEVVLACLLLDLDLCLDSGRVGGSEVAP